MNESRGLRCLSGFLIGHPDDGEFAQLLINEGSNSSAAFGLPCWIASRMRVTSLMRADYAIATE
jgi:hypothetical protein